VGPRPASARATGAHPLSEISTPRSSPVAVKVEARQTCDPCVPNGLRLQNTIEFTGFFGFARQPLPTFVHGHSWAFLGLQPNDPCSFASHLKRRSSAQLRCCCQVLAFAESPTGHQKPTVYTASQRLGCRVGLATARPVSAARPINPTPGRGLRSRLSLPGQSKGESNRGT
jgi:hypothetical protein